MDPIKENKQNWGISKTGLLGRHETADTKKTRGKNGKNEDGVQGSKGGPAS